MFVKYELYYDGKSTVVTWLTSKLMLMEYLQHYLGFFFFEAASFGELYCKHYTVCGCVCVCEIKRERS